MAVFSGLAEKFNHIFSKLTKRGALTELEIKQAMREVRIALLEADVNYLVVKKFIADVTEKAIGEKVMKSLTPGQQVIKIVNEELTALMGGTNAKLDLSSSPSVIMLCGLQGAGKTTMCGKLALNLKKQGKKPLLVACDIYRPAAINQLKVLGASIQIPVFEKGTQNPVKTATEAINFAKSNMNDVVIIDTAGRLHIDEKLMQELCDIKEKVKPNEILLTVDAMTGQDAVNVAETFNNALDITGVILTKLDGDTRGGAALSIKAVTNKPIKFCGVGEKLNDLEVFYPDRMASRLLDMGDVLSLIEKASEVISEEEAEKQAKKFLENTFTLNDFLIQIEQIQKLGNLGDLLKMIPGMQSKLAGVNIDESQFNRYKAIIQSMTMKERTCPETLKASHRQRIAKGSGTSIQDVNALIKQFEQSKQMMKQFKNKKGGLRFPF